MSKAVCVSSRVIFEDGWDSIEKEIRSAGFEAFFPKKEDFSGKNEQESLALMKQVLERYYPQIESAEILYVYAPNGDVSGAVCAEIGYAKAKGNKIISSEKVAALEIQAMINEIVPVKELGKYLKEEANV